MTDLFGDRDPNAIIRVWDVETTGFHDNPEAEIVDIGRVDVRIATLAVENAWTTLVQPKGDIPPETRAIHHIGPEDVKDAPRIGDVWKEMWSGLSDTDFIAAHNAEFEKAFHNGNGRRWICTYRCALHIWPDAPSHSNQALRYWLDLEGRFLDFDNRQAMPPHRSLPDAYVTGYILARMLELGHSPEYLAKITEAPALLMKLRFGKHKGERFSDVPLDYLDWIADKSDLNRDVKHSARVWIERRRGA